MCPCAWVCCASGRMNSLSGQCQCRSGHARVLKEHRQTELQPGVPRTSQGWLGVKPAGVWAEGDVCRQCRLCQQAFTQTFCCRPDVPGISRIAAVVEHSQLTGARMHVRMLRSAWRYVQLAQGWQQCSMGRHRRPPGRAWTLDDTSAYTRATIHAMVGCRSGVKPGVVSNQYGQIKQKGRWDVLCAGSAGCANNTCSACSARIHKTVVAAWRAWHQ